VFGFDFQTARTRDASDAVIASDSEAIHRAAGKARVDCFVAFAPLRKRFAFVAGNDGGTQLRNLAARFARVLRLSLALEKRGRRESRVRAAPAVSCAKWTKECAHEHTGSAEASRLSLRDGFTAYFVLSPVNGLCCHRRPQEACFSRA
jgi:hypothetical protein